MSKFVQSLHEVFERFGRIEARRMFGGQGIYHDGRMFALVNKDNAMTKKTKPVKTSAPARKAAAR